MFFGYCFFQLIGSVNQVSDMQFFITAVCTLIEMSFEFDVIKVLRTGENPRPCCCEDDDE